MPPHMIKLSEPNAADLADAVGEAIKEVKNVRPHAMHAEVAKMYNWVDVSKRTEEVYQRVSQQPRLPFIERLRRYYGSGPWAGKLNCAIATLHLLWLLLLEWLQPASEIEIAPDLPLDLHRRIDESHASAAL